MNKEPWNKAARLYFKASPGYCITITASPSSAWGISLLQCGVRCFGGNIAQIRLQRIERKRFDANHNIREIEMETVGLGRYFEDMTVGTQFKTIGRTITETDSVNFVN